MLELDKYGVKIFDKSFEGDVSKEVYLQACKWLAINVYGSPTYAENISVQIKKSQKKVEKLVRENKTGKIIKQEHIRTVFTVSLYCEQDIKSVMDKFCSDCKHLHTVFYSVDKPNCDECRVKALQKKMEHEVNDLARSLRHAFEKGEENG